MTNRSLPQDIEFDLGDLDGVSGGVGTHALAGMLPRSLMAQSQQFDPGGYHAPSPLGIPSAVQALMPNQFAPQGAPTGLPTGGLPNGYVAVPQSVLQQLQYLATHPTAAPIAPRPVAPPPQPQANPFAQIQQGLGLANQVMGMFRGMGGGGAPQGGAQQQGGMPQGGMPQGMPQQGGQDDYGPPDQGYDGGFPGGDFGFGGEY